MSLIETETYHRHAEALTHTHEATGLYHEREARLVKVTKIRDDKSAENNVCGGGG